MGLLKEFKQFAMKGNVMDLAVGVVVGAAFSGIVNSLVKDIIMPLVGLITGGVNLAELSISLGPAVGDTPGPALAYGSFLQAGLNFLIIAFSMFMVVKGINRINAQLPFGEKPVAPPPPHLCIYCKKEIDEEATKCPYCTADLPAPETSEDEAT